MLNGYIRTMVSGKASRQILLNQRKMSLMTLVNLEGMIKMMKIFKFNQMSNQLLLKKGVLFTLHYVRFKLLIMTHQKTPLRLEAYNLEGSHFK